MARKEYLFTSESVSEGHPDKVADQIADAVVDAYLEKDPTSRVNIAACVTQKKIVLGGKVQSKAIVDYELIIRELLKNIGYNDIALGLDYTKCSVENYITNMNEINQPFDSTTDGIKMIFGYAINDSDAFMPLTITLAHTIMRKLTQLRKDKKMSFLRPDAKCQITIQYDSKGKPKRMDSLILNTQHSEKITLDELKEALIEDLIYKTIPNSLIDKNTEIHINPGGKYFVSDISYGMGISGRKTAIDTYGGWSRYTDEPLSGKDPYNVERAASYMLRKIAKNFVAAGIVQKIELQTSYSSGIKGPVALYVDSFGTGKISDDKINKKIYEKFNLDPKSIVKELELIKSDYQKTACYGHFGRHEPSFTWEMIDKINDLK